MSVQKIVVTLLVLLFATSAGAVEVKVTDWDSRWSVSGPTGYDPSLDGLPPGDDNSVIAPYSSSHYAEITLYASQIKLYVITSTQGATADILIDGQVKVSGADWYSSPAADHVMLYDSGTLSAGAHTFRVENCGDWVNIDYLMIVPGPDYDPPTPDPMTWATAPYASGDASVTMVATTAEDASGVEYYFACTSGGGHDSGWQDSTTYRDGGLTPNSPYCYQVKARDKGDYQNETAYSTPAACATTHTLDSTPPTPDPMTWAAVPHAVGPTFIAMEATTASDTSGVEYNFICTAGGGNSSGWQVSPSYMDEGLTPEVTYTYTVTARDRSYTVNYTAASTAEQAATPAYVPLVWDWALKGHRREWRFTTFTASEQGFDTFNDIKADLDNILMNGINNVFLYCVYHGNPANFNGCSPVDLYTTTPASGTPAELQSLIDTAHSKGLAVTTYFCFMYMDDTSPFWLQAEQDMGASLDTHYTRCFAWGDLKKDVVFHSDDGWCDGTAYSETAGKWYGTSWDLPGLDFSTQDTIDEGEAVAAYWGGYGLDGYMWDYPVSMGNTNDATRKWLLTTLPRYYGATYLRAEGIEVQAHMNQYMENVDMNFMLIGEEGPLLRNIYGDGWTKQPDTTGDFETSLTTVRDPMVAYHEEAGVEALLSQDTDILPADTRVARMAQEVAAFGGAGIWTDAWYGIGQWGRKYWSSDVANEVAKVANALNNSDAFETAGERNTLLSSGTKYVCRRVGRSGKEGLAVFQCSDQAADVKVTMKGSGFPLPCSTWDIVNDVAGPDITTARTHTFSLPAYGYLLLEIVGTGGPPPSLPPASGDAFVANINLYDLGLKANRAVAEITVEDEGGRPVQGARVYVDWLGDYQGSDVGSTNTLGNVRLNTPEVVGGSAFTVAVTNVVDQEYTYNPALNVETCDTIGGGPPCPGPRSPYANGESTAAGTVSGDYTDTQASDDVYEAITERESGGKPSTHYSYLDHTWTFDSDGGTFSVEAYKTANTEGDDFVFAYNAGSGWVNMLTVIKTSDDDIAQTYGNVPAGSVDVRVLDTDQTAGNTVLDTIYVDYMKIE